MPLPWDEPTSPLGRDYLAARALIRQGSRSFFAASLLLPMAVRMPACALYAFCRLSDDAVDDPGAEADAVQRLLERLDKVYAGRPAAIAADRAFADVVARFDLPYALPRALIDGLAFDAEGGRIETLHDLYAYAAQVAGSVGAMMTVIMGVRDPAVLARACDLGVAMQFTNVARDVGEDARNGRLYLPRVWFGEAGVDPDAFLARPFFDARVAALIDRLLTLADVAYARAERGVGGLPRACRPAIHAARMIYREIGWELRRNGLDSVARRTVVSDRRKLMLAAQAFAAAGVGSSGAFRAEAPALFETQYLVDAAAGRHAERAAREAARLSLDDRVGWIITLFNRLQERELMDDRPVHGSATADAS